MTNRYYRQLTVIVPTGNGQQTVYGIGLERRTDMGTMAPYYQADIAPMSIADSRWADDFRGNTPRNALMNAFEALVVTLEGDGWLSTDEAGGV